MDIIFATEPGLTGLTAKGTDVGTLVETTAFALTESPAGLYSADFSGAAGSYMISIYDSSDAVIGVAQHLFHWDGVAEVDVGSFTDSDRRRLLRMSALRGFEPGDLMTVNASTGQVTTASGLTVTESRNGDGTIRTYSTSDPDA